MSKSANLCLAACIALPSSAFALALGGEGQDYGKLDAMVKLQHVVTGQDNGYDPNDGSAYLLKAKYVSPSYGGVKWGSALYLTGDLFGLTDFHTEKVARGIFVNSEGDDKGQVGEAFLRYDGERLDLSGGRMMLKTPLTTIPYSTLPNFYTAYRVGFKPTGDLDLGLSRITEMSFGARAMTDFGLIGEGTGTAGAATRPDLIGQADFHKISVATLGNGAEDTDGITTFSASYGGLKGTRLQVWDYYVHDIANNLYMDVDAKIPAGGVKALLGLQYLHQSEVGDALAGERDYRLYGLKAGVGGKGWALWAAYNNSSGNTSFLNGWGGDPAYTSTIFSRNAYRENVDAWGVGAKYVITKGLVFVAKHMQYGKSDTLGRISGVGVNLQAIDDAQETDLVLMWKPPQVKGLTVKTFYADRTSEYNGSNGHELTQKHWRLILSYAL